MRLQIDHVFQIRPSTMAIFQWSWKGLRNPLPSESAARDMFSIHIEHRHHTSCATGSILEPSQTDAPTETAHSPVRPFHWCLHQDTTILSTVFLIVSQSTLNSDLQQLVLLKFNNYHLRSIEPPTKTQPLTLPHSSTFLEPTKKAEIKTSHTFKT